jgi:hypothetical protein
MIFVDTSRAFCWIRWWRFCAALLIECKRDLIRKAFKKFSRALAAYLAGFVTMLAFWRQALMIALTTLAISSPGQAACGPGIDSCGPSANEMRAKIAQLLDAALLTPHTIVAVEKRDGREIETQGRRTYEMRFSVVLNYSGDRLRCRVDLCPELHNYLLEIDAAAKKATISGWLFFEQAGDEWR